MAIFKCKMCGGDLEISSGTTVAECEYCGTRQTVSCSDDEKRINLFNRANRLRINNEFDKAANIYESIVAEFPEEAEAYWGLVICNYGIEYVDDPATGKKMPTCHRASFESIQKDENYKLALEYADVNAQKVYRDEAREIDRIREEILAISKNEKPYDIFICYKETDDKGERTIDSVIAQDVYDALIDKGYKVFFSRISLEDKLGRQYEPYIFAALNSAKVMLSFGTKYEYFHAVWVKNEWSRFLKLMAKDKAKVLIPCYKDMDAYDLPDEFKALQAQDMGKVGAMQDLVRGIGKIIETPISDFRNTNNVVAINQNHYRFTEKQLTENEISTVVSLVETMASLNKQFKDSQSDDLRSNISKYIKDLFFEISKMLERYNHNDYRYHWIIFCIYKGYYPHIENYIDKEQIDLSYKTAVDLAPDYLKYKFQKERDKSNPDFEFLIFNQDKLKQEYESDKSKPQFITDGQRKDEPKKTKKRKSVPIAVLLIAILLVPIFIFVMLLIDNAPQDELKTKTVSVKKLLLIVGYTNFAPMNYFDASGELVGFDTELAKTVFNNLGYAVVFEEILWEDKYTNLETGEIDCIWNAFECDKADSDGVLRSEKVDFSYAYISGEDSKYAVGFKKGSKLTQEVNAELERLAADGTIEELAQKYGLENEVVTDFSNQK